MESVNLTRRNRHIADNIASSVHGARYAPRATSELIREIGSRPRTACGRPPGGVLLPPKEHTVAREAHRGPGTVDVVRHAFRRVPRWAEVDQTGHGEQLDADPLPTGQG